jgi:endonuclease/exonuclease/phosphatase family metal-dependent hydrolase
MMRRWRVVLTALTFVFGAQSLRVQLPSITWYWRATLQMPPGLVLTGGLAPLVLAWLAPLAARRLGLSRTLWALGISLLACRLVEQFASDPAIDVWAALGGVASFMGLLPLLFARATAHGEEGRQSFGAGLLLGLSADTALRGLTGTLDLSWIAGAWPRLVILALAGLFAYALWRVNSEQAAEAGDGRLAILPLIGLGPLLFVEWQYWQNQGWVATLTGWPPTAALAWICLGNVAALAAASAASSRRVPGTRLTLLASGGLTLSLVLAQTPGWTFAVAALAGLVCAGWLVSVSVGAAQQPARAGALGLAFGLGLSALIGLIVLYYFSFLVPLLPFPRARLAPLAGVMVAACALAAVWSPSAHRRPGAPEWAPVGLGLILLLAPLALLIAESAAPPQTLKPAGRSVRVMTYNIRGAYGLSDRQDVEAIALVIEGAGAQVVGLQEVSRGWLVDGSTDLLPLLSRRLSMPDALLVAATDPIGVNALLSQHRLVDGGHGDLAQMDSLVRRGYVAAYVDWQSREPLLIINTHLATESSALRSAQVADLLAAWAGRPRTVLLGDINAQPGTPEIQSLLDAGFIDAWTEAGQPERRHIDWILHTPDLMAREVVVIDSPASDHPALAATIVPRP